MFVTAGVAVVVVIVVAPSHERHQGVVALVREAVVGSNEVPVQLGADAGTGETYASAEDFAGVVVVRIGGTGGLGVLGVDCAEGEYRVSGQGLDLL